MKLVVSWILCAAFTSAVLISLNAQAAKIPDGALIKSKQHDEVYLIRDGQRHHIPDPPTLEAKWSWKQVRIVSQEEVDAIPLGDPLPSVLTGVPFAKKGDLPPRNAMALSIPQARAVLRDTIAKRYPGPLNPCQQLGPLRSCLEYTLSPAGNVSIRPTDLSFAAPGSHRWTGFVPSNFKTTSPR